MPVMTAVLTLQMSGLPQIYAYSKAYADESNASIVSPVGVTVSDTPAAGDNPADLNTGETAGGGEGSGASDTAPQTDSQPADSTNQADSYIRPGVLRIDDFIFDTTTNTIEKYVGTSETVVVPESFMVNGAPVSVKHIGNEAFKLQDAELKIKAVSLPQGLETIGEYAFTANEIKTLVIPASVVEIKEGAFAANKLTGTTGLQIPVDSKLVKIDKLAFDDNLLTSLNLTNASVLEEIGEAAFSQNELTDVKFPVAIQKIGNRAFQENEFTEIDIPDSVASFGSGVFASCGRYVVVRTKSSAVNNDVIKGEFGSVVNPTVVWVKGIDEKTGNVIVSTKAVSFNPFVEAELDQMPLAGNNATFSDIKVHEYKLKPGTSLVLTPEFLASNSQANPYELYYISSVGDPKITGNTPLYFMVNQTIDKTELLRDITAADSEGEDITSKVVVSPESIDSSVAGTHSVTISVTDSEDRTTTVYRDVTVALNPLDMETGKGWIMSDFNYIGNRVSGFSPQGEIKARTNHTVVLPAFSPEPDPVTGKLLPIYEVEHFSDKNIKSVVLPPNLKKICYDAFSGNQLSSIDIPESVTVIANSAFMKNRLLKVKLPDNLTSLGAHAFKHNHLTEVNIPATLDKIQDYAFAENSISRLTIPETVVELGNGAFEKNNLAYIRVPKSISKMGTWVFANNDLIGFDWDTPLTKIPDGTFQDNNFNEIIIPPHVTVLGNYSFANGGVFSNPKDNDRVTRIVFNDKLEVIGDGAFRHHGLQMEELIFPETLREIGKEAFYNYSYDSAVSSSIGNIYLPDSVQKIGKCAFEKNGIHKIRMSQGVKEIGEAAFERNFIESVDLPETLTVLNNAIFKENKLKELHVPEGVVSVGEFAFTHNDIEKLTLPSTLKVIERSAFSDNKMRELILPDGLEDIKWEAFKYCKLESIDIPDSVTSIGSEAFQSNKLEHVKLSNNLTYMGAKAFAHNAIQAIEIPESISKIYAQVFAGNQIAELHIPKNVEVISEEAFSRNSLTKVTSDPDGKLKAIGPYAFDGNLLTEVTLPSSLEEIKENAFAYNPGWDPFSGIDPLSSQVGKGSSGINPNTEKRVKVSITKNGVPFTSPSLKFHEKDKHIVNPAFLVVKHVLANDKSYEVAPPNYVVVEFGENKKVNPIESKYYKAVDENPRIVNIDNDMKELTIEYNAVPIYDTSHLRIDLKHLEPTSRVVTDGARLTEGLEDKDNSEFYLMASITCEDALAFDLDKPWVYIKLDEPVARRLYSVRFIDEGVGLASEWLYENGYLKIHLDRTLRAGSQQDLAIGLRFRNSIPDGAIVDFTNAAAIYHEGTLVKRSTNKLAARNRFSTELRFDTQYPVSKYVEIEDKGNGKKYAAVTADTRVEYKEPLYFVFETVKPGELTCEVDIPTYTGLDENGVESSSLRAQLDPESNKEWKVDSTGTKIYRTVEMYPDKNSAQANRFIHSGNSPVFLFPRVKIDQAITANVNGRVSDVEHTGMYSGSLNEAQAKFNADAPYDTTIPGSSASGKLSVYFYDKDRAIDEKVKSSKAGYLNPSQIGNTQTHYKELADPYVYVPSDHMSASGKYYMTNGMSHMLDRALSTNKLHDGFYDTQENREKESPWSFYYRPELYNGVDGSIVRIDDFTVVANQLDPRMKWTGVNLPTTYYKAQVEAYSSDDATGAPIFQKEGYVGRMTFPESVAPQIKSVKVKFSPEDIANPNEVGVKRLIFFSHLREPEKKQYTPDFKELGAKVNQYSSTVAFSGNVVISDNGREIIDTVHGTYTDSICVIPADEGTLSLEVEQDENGVIVPNKDIDYAVSVSAIKPRMSQVNDFVVVDVLPPYVNAQDVKLTDSFMASAVNPSAELIENIDGRGSWGVIIRADSYNPTKLIDSSSPYETSDMQIATINAKTSRFLGTGVYPNRAWMAFNNVAPDAVDATDIINKQKGTVYNHKDKSISPDSKASEVLGAYPDKMISSSGDAFSVVNSSEFTTFLSIKRGTDANAPWNDSYVFAGSNEDFVYRMNLIRNKQIIPPALDIIQVLPYNDDLRLQVNNDGVRNPRKTDMIGVTIDGDNYTAQVELTGPVACTNPALSDQFDFLYTTTDPSTIKGLSPKGLRENITWVDASALPLKDGHPDWSKVTAVRVTCKDTEEAYKDTQGLFFDLPMREPENVGYALDDCRAVTSFVRWISTDENEEGLESNSVWSIMESDSVDLQIHKLSVDPLVVDPKTGEKKEEPLSGVEFKLWQVYNEKTDGAKSHKSIEMLDGTSVEVLTEPMYSFPQSFDVVADTKRSQGVSTNGKGNALYHKVKVKHDYILEETVPQGYKTTAESIQRISGADMKANMVDGVYTKTVRNVKIIKMTPIIPQKLSLSFNKVGVTGKPIAFVDFKLSATSSTGYEWSQEASSSPRSGLVSFTDVPEFGQLPADNGVGKPYALTEIQPQGMLKPIDPIEIRFAKNVDADGNWLAKSDVERNAFGEVVKVNAFGYEDQVANNYTLEPIYNRRVDLPVYVIGLTKPSDIAKNYEDLSFSNGFRVKNVKVALADNQEMTENLRELTTDVDGRVEFENLLADKDYFVKQLTVQKDFTIYPDVLKVRIDEHGVLYINDKISSNDYGLLPDVYAGTNALEIHKTSQKNGEGKSLEGATFELWEITKDADGNVAYVSDQPEQTQTTDENGRLAFKDFAVIHNDDGTRVHQKKSYQLKEVAAPVGYTVVDKPFEFTTVENEIYYQQINVANPPISLELHKVDFVTREPIAGAEFALYENANAEGTPIETKVSDSEGIVRFEYSKFTNTKEYSLREIKVPEGYNPEALKEVIPVHIPDFENRSGWKGKMVVSAFNIPLPSRLTITKRDALSYKTLPGVEFDLLDEKKEKVAGPLATDEYGKLTFDNLEDGIYYIHEVEAPEHFVAAESDTRVVINGSRAYYATIDNYRKPVDFKLHNIAKLEDKATGEEATFDLKGSKFTIQKLFSGVPIGPSKTLTTAEDGSLNLEGLSIGAEYMLVQDTTQSSPLLEKGILGGYGHGAWTLKLEDQGIGVRPEITFKEYAPKTQKIPPTEFTVDNDTSEILVTNHTELPKLDLTISKEFAGGKNLDDTSYKVIVYGTRQKPVEETVAAGTEVVSPVEGVEAPVEVKPADTAATADIPEANTADTTDVAAPIEATAANADEGESEKAQKPQDRVVLGEGLLVKGAGEDHASVVLTNLPAYYFNVEKQKYEAYILSYEEVIAPKPQDQTEVEYAGTFEPVFGETQINPVLGKLNVLGSVSLTNTYTAGKINLDLNLGWEGDALPEIKPDTWFVLERKLPGSSAVEECAFQKFEDGTLHFDFGQHEVTDNDGTPYIYSVRQVNENKEDAVPEFFIQKAKIDAWTPVQYGEQSHTFEAVNIHQIPDVALSLNLEWDGEGLPATKPSTWFVLERTIEGVEERELLSTTKVEGVDSIDLGKYPATDKAGNPYIYTVRQTDAQGANKVPDHYTQTERDVTFTAVADRVDQSHIFDVLNTHSIVDIHLDMTLEWQGEGLPEVKPDTWFVLERTSQKNTTPEKLDTQKLSDGTVKVDFGMYPSTDAEGNAYTYTVRQTNAEGVNGVPDGFEQNLVDETFTAIADVDDQTHTFQVVNIIKDVDQGEPEVPVEPETPVEPEAPVEPEIPVEPETPVHPPTVPEVPVEPEVPVVVPSVPVVPEVPVVIPPVVVPEPEPVVPEPEPAQKVIEVPRTYDSSLSGWAYVGMILLGTIALVGGVVWQKKQEK